MKKCIYLRRVKGVPKCARQEYFPYCAFYKNDEYCKYAKENY